MPFLKKKMKKYANIKSVDVVYIGYIGDLKYDITTQEHANIILKTCDMLPSKFINMIF